jgi:hypothetical protein
MGFQAIFKSAFPFISTAASLGGPFATMAVNAVGKALGVDNVTPDNVDDVIATATSKDPDAMLKLKQAEQEFQLQMQKLGFENVQKLEEMASADRASARAREMSVRDKTPAVLAYAVTAGFFSLLWLLAFHSVPVQSERILDVMVGSLGTAWIGVVTYYFGSSAGSAEKTRLMAQSSAGK